MMIRKKIRAQLLRDLVQLPDEISDDSMLEIVIREADASGNNSEEDQHRRSVEELTELFHSRIRAAGFEESFVEEVFSLDEVCWQDLNEVKNLIEGEGYGVRLDPQGSFVRFKILRRYV